jgi:hypothetical protein
MLGSTFDTITRQAAARFSRRTSLLTLGAAGLAALAGPLPTRAKKKGGNKTSRKKLQRLANRKCQGQVAPCETALIQGGVPEATACCQPLGDCDYNAFLICLSAFV